MSYYFQFINWLFCDGKVKTIVVKLLVPCSSFSGEKSTLSHQLKWKNLSATLLLHWIIQKLSTQLKCPPLITISYLWFSLVISNMTLPVIFSLPLFSPEFFSIFLLSSTWIFMQMYDMKCYSLFSSKLPPWIILTLPRFWSMVFNIKHIIRKKAVLE